jgi:hypothetical protein
MTLLASETFDLGHSYSLDAELGQGLPDVIEAEGFDDRGDHFHKADVLCGRTGVVAGSLP